MTRLDLIAGVIIAAACAPVVAQAADPPAVQSAARSADRAARSGQSANAAANRALQASGDARLEAQRSEQASTQADQAAKKAEQYALRTEKSVRDAADACPTERPVKHTTGYNLSKGNLKSSRCVIDHLREDLLADDDLPVRSKYRLTTADVRRRTARLITLYQARSARQQVWIDLSSGTTGVFSLAAVAESGVSGSTLSYLGGAALVPIIISQFNAHEPTRDLYTAGAVGMMMLTTRYDGYSKAVGLFDRYQGSDAKALVAAAEASCRALPGLVKDLQAGLIDSSDKGALLSEIKAVTAACNLLLADLGAMRGYRGALAAWEPRMAQFYGQDVLMLDSLLVQRDQQLRATPLDVLSGIAASPFSAASTLLTGEDGRQAIGKIKTQEAIGNLDMKATPIRLPPLPKFAFTATADLAAPSLEGVRAKLPQLIDPKLKPDLNPKLDAVEKAVVDVNLAKPIFAYQQALAADVAAIAAADQLKFTYDTTSRKVEVILAAPEKPATPAAK